MTDSSNKKDSSVQLSPVKKRVKECSPPQQQQQQYRGRNTPVQQPWQQQHQQQQHFNGNARNPRQPTITIEDTPSPAVSVITISDSDDEGGSNAASSQNKSNGCRSRAGQQQPQQQRGMSNRQVVSCVTVPDSDEEHRSPAKGHHQQSRQQQQYTSNNSYVARDIKPEPSSLTHSSSFNAGPSGSNSLAQKKRLLAKAQEAECSNGNGGMISNPKQEQNYHSSTDGEAYSSGHHLDYASGSGNGNTGTNNGNDRPSVTSTAGHQPCDYSSGDASLHLQPTPLQVSQQSQQQQQQQQRSYRSDYADGAGQQHQQQSQQRDYLHPPAAHRQQRFDAELQQQREQNGYYSKKK